MPEYVSAIVTVLASIYCMWRGAKYGRWAEGLCLGAVLGINGVVGAIIGVVGAYELWPPKHRRSLIRPNPEFWAKWSHPGVSIAALILAVAALFVRLSPFIGIALLTKGQKLVIQGCIFGVFIIAIFSWDGIRISVDNQQVHSAPNATTISLATRVVDARNVDVP